MALCSNNKNPLQRSGTSQSERMQPALDTGYVSVDERGYDDWIVFANSFSKFLHFFDGSGPLPVGDWSPFFTSDISSVLGAISVQEIDTHKQQLKERFDFLKSNENELDTAGLKTKLNELFSALFTISKAMDEYYARLPDTISLKVTLLNLIKSKLAPALYRLMGYYNAAEAGGYLVHASFNGWRILNRDVIDAAEFKSGAQTLGSRWITTAETDWVLYFTSAGIDKSIFENQLLIPGLEDFLAIEHAANHNLFSGIFDQFLFAFTKFVNDAGAELMKTLGDWDSHQPHYALFLAFLKLFRFSQQQANTITKRHLDFYYKEVLRLAPKAAEPNKVHVIAELAKQVESYMLSKETELKAGKDSTGKDVIYALDNDAVFNKAKVALLKNIYKAAGTDSIIVNNITQQYNKGRLFAAPVTNSDDGAGAELAGANKEWHPYVHKIYNEASLTAIALPKAQVGFAVASKYLYLTEGEREVRVRFKLSDRSLFNNVAIECWLTTAKAWYQVASPVITGNNVQFEDGTACGEIMFTLTGDEPPVTDYNTAVHGGNFNADVPVLKVYLTQNDKAAYQYDRLRNLIVSNIEIYVAVGMNTAGNNFKKGLKNLMLSNSSGPVDASKDFMPFGPQPNKDAAFIIGHKELFSKKNLSFNLNINWSDFPATAAIDYERLLVRTYNPNNNTFYYVAGAEGTPAPLVFVNYLSSGIWQSNAAIPAINIFSGAAVNAAGVVTDPQVLPESFFADYDENYTAYSANSTKGFLKLVLERSFGYKEYLADLTQYLIEEATKATVRLVPVKPTEPYTPLMQSLYISYKAHEQADLTETDEATFNERNIMFFNIYPFGEAEQHAYLGDGNEVFLLPQFSHTEKITTGANQTETVYHHNGEFYIGIENLQPKEAVSILFQVLEGSTSPQMAKPENHIHWSIMGNNRWLEFGRQDVIDNTLSLLQSGIVSFAIPAEATADNTVLPAGYIWIRASISEIKNTDGTVKDINTAEAVCRLLSVNAQAAAATFKPNNNADDFLDAALAAGTVSKLKVPDAAIKKITQPYPSFGGRAKESSDHFYIRVSERLRHKGRAITIWDYEHIILEAFPEIYKVKCLNHTGLAEDADGKEYTNELMPGHVLIITIPVLLNRNDTNILKPFTNQGTLTKIEAYLGSRVSCFVTVKARQPLFEEVNMAFSLKLKPQYPDFIFYSGMLQNAITQYLTPWAYNSNEDIQFGGKMYKSSLINFIEEQYYVDYITEVKMFLTVDNTTHGTTDMEVIAASTVRSILVSAPASKHIITEINETEDTAVEVCNDLNAPQRVAPQPQPFLSAGALKAGRIG